MASLVSIGFRDLRCWYGNSRSCDGWVYIVTSVSRF